MDNENYKLCFVKYIGQDDNDMFIYDLLFTENDDTFWGEGFEIIPSCISLPIFQHLLYKFRKFCFKQHPKCFLQFILKPPVLTIL